jgi:hypothetical protein
MRKSDMITLASLTAIAFSTLVGASLASQQRQEGNARGRYLAEEVARCWECHSPRDRSGEPDHSRWLQGATMWFAPVHPVQNWAYSAPAIAGLGGFTEAQGLQVLEQGTGPDGRPVRPPMHPYHLSHQDALAIVAYLKSLQSSTR